MFFAYVSSKYTHTHTQNSHAQRFIQHSTINQFFLTFHQRCWMVYVSMYVHSYITFHTSPQEAILNVSSTNFSAWNKMNMMKWYFSLFFSTLNVHSNLLCVCLWVCGYMGTYIYHRRMVQIKRDIAVRMLHLSNRFWILIVETFTLFSPLLLSCSFHVLHAVDEKFIRYFSVWFNFASIVIVKFLCWCSLGGILRCIFGNKEIIKSVEVSLEVKSRRHFKENSKNPQQQ
jgi:hypothetical protein